MPIINGQKVACAPCIRGHRSTKCNHAAERVMVPVRKPGRPLSTCPCPPDQPCGCGGVKVAIPRKQKCHCGGSEHDANESHPDPAPVTSVAGETPTSPTPARPQYRVNKPGTGSRQNSRKPSIEPSQLGRMDPNSVNIVNHFGSMDTNAMGLLGSHLGAPITTTAVPAIGYLASAANGFGGHLGLGYQTSLGYGSPQHQVPRVQQISQSILLQNGVKESPSAMPTPVMATIPLAVTSNGANGHVGGHSNGVTHAPITPTLSPQPNGSSNGGGRSSCCANKKQSPEIKPNMAPPPTVDSSKTFMPPVTLGLKVTQDYQDPYIHQTVYTYPANYGSFTNPVNQDIWLQVSSMNNALPVEGSTDPLGFSHECSCGPGCSCVGCLAHPFNQEMFNYVSNAYNDTGVSPTDAYGSGNGHIEMSATASSPPTANNTDGTPSTANNALSSCCGGSSQIVVKATEPPSPPPAQTPSDASGFSEEQSLSTSDYFFVNIPYDPSACNGSEVFCPCGDDCACEGCVVHKTSIGPPM